MGELTAFTQSYLAPAPDSPWTWADGGQVLAWKTGATIAFLPEVRAVLARVAREAEVVPPFLAVALLLEALRGDPRGSLTGECAGWIREDLTHAESSPKTRLIALASLTHFERALGVLARLPAEFWARPDAKELVAVAVFEAGSVRRDPSHAALLASALEHGRTPWGIGPRAEVASRRVEAWSEAFSILLHGLARFDPAAFLLRAKTGLEQLPAPAELPLAPRGGARELLDELRNDEELADVAALARRLLATMYLPRPITRHEDLPIGGVSDITNRGSFERLLASELAHDDLTLAVRIALNEALYTRRESPPRSLDGARCVLVDTGIRMWGLARVFAAAVGLALVASSERHRPVRVFRPGEGRLEPVDLTQREGLVALLAALASAPHPGASVERFLAEVGAAGEGSEAFLVTHERALSDPDFCGAARQLGEAHVHAVLVDSEGHLRIEARSPRGARTLHEARLDLSALLRKKPSRRRSVPASVHELPAFLQVVPSPLLVPHDLGRCWLAAAPDGTVVAWTHEQELAHWFHPGWAPRRLAHLPGPRLVWLFECTEEGVVHLVKSDERRRVVWFRHDLRTGRSELREVVDEPPGLQFASLIGADLLLASQRDSWLIEGAATGPVRATSLAATWLGGRRFRTPAHPLALLRLSPSGPSFEPEPSRGPPFESRDVQACFTRGESSDTWVLRKGGANWFAAFALGSGEHQIINGWLPSNVRFTRSSRDGRYVLDHTGRWRIDSLTSSAAACQPVEALQAVTGHQLPLRGFPLRNQLQAIGLGTRGELVLTDPKRRPLAFRSSNWQRMPVPEIRSASDVRVVRLVPFERAEVGDARITRQARSPRGDRAFLDRRGLLHLVPSDSKEQEVTVVLAADRPTAMWCSDGRVHGMECFTGRELAPTDGDTMSALLRSFAEGFA